MTGVENALACPEEVYEINEDEKAHFVRQEDFRMVAINVMDI